MKKVLYTLCIILALGLFGSLGSILEDDSDNPSEIQPFPTNTSEVGIIETEASLDINTIPVVENNSVIYSENEIELTYVKIKGTKYFEYEIRNNSTRDIQFSFDAVAVNNCMVPDLMAMGVVTTGNKAVHKYDLAGTKDYNIDNIETIDIYIVVSDRETFEILDKEIVHLDVSEAKDFKYSHSLEQFFDDKYITAYSEMRSDEYNDFEVLYYNKTDKIISAALTDVAVNDIMVMYNLKPATILPGCYAYTGVSDGTTTIYSAVDAELEKMEPINKIEGKLALWAEFFDFGYATTNNMIICTVN